MKSKYKSIIIFYLVFINYIFSQSISIKLVFEAGFSTNFQQGNVWYGVNENLVKDIIINRVIVDFENYGISVSTSSGNLIAYIGRDGDPDYFGNAVSGIGSYIDGSAYAEIYSNNFGLYKEWKNQNATKERIGEAIAGSVSHELGHLLNLYHAYMFDSFDPTISGALNGDYQPNQPDDLPASCKTDQDKYKHLMATLSNYISLEQRATENRFFSQNSNQILNFAVSGGCSISRNTTWGINGKSFYQQNNISVGSGLTFIIASGGYTHYLNNYWINGGTIQKQGTVSPYNIILKNGSTLTGIFPTIAAALSNATSGQTVEVLNGSHNITQSISVTSGVTLQLDQGVTLNFSSGTGLTVYGTMNANGNDYSNRVTFTGSGWNGISLYSSNVSMSYCKITGASCGINIESASPTIQWTWINNCGGGIGVYGGGPTLINNTIAYNTGYGLNSIVFSNVFMGYNKNNIIAQCISGINAYSYGTVYAYQGNNSIHDNHNGTYEVTASSGGNVQADYNWWGQSSPPSSWFYQGLGGTISYNNALDSDPNSGRSLYKQVTIPISSNRVISQSSSTEDELNQAYKFWQEKQYNSTIEKCKSILSTNPVSTIAYPALSLLRLAAQEIKDSDIETYLQNAALANEKNEFGGVALLNHSYYLLFKGQYSSALSMLDFAINKYKNTDIEKAAMFQKILTLFNHLKDDKTGEEELARFESKYTDDDLVKELRRLINRPDLPKFSQKQSKQSSSNDDIVNDEELSNYPNPFNPTTNIVFRIADVGFVTLKIYDILGREVTALVDEVKAPGKYVIPFNADKLSSGTYYYRLIITPSNGEKEIIQQRAMQVIK